MQRIKAVRQKNVTKAPELLAVLLGTALAVACGGPAAVLHDVLDEAEERVDLVLESYDDTEGEMNEVAAMELPACPTEYEPPPLSEGPPPYEDVVERSAELPDAAELNGIRSTHETVCRGGGAALRAIPGMREQLQPQLEDFSDYAEALRNFIDDDMTDEDIESLSAEVDAVARARPEEDDTLQLRYERLNDRVIELSPLVREMARGARRPGARVRPGFIPDPEAGESLAEILEPWTTVIEAHGEARAFFEVWNDYRRRIYEGPDAEDPDEAAADWSPPTGVWNGEYARSRRLSARGDPARRIRVTFQAEGALDFHWLEDNCGALHQLTSTSGAFGRVTQYRETSGSCVYNGTVTLERTGEDRMRVRWTAPGYGNYAGNLTRQ